MHRFLISSVATALALALAAPSPALAKRSKSSSSHSKKSKDSDKSEKSDKTSASKDGGKDAPKDAPKEGSKDAPKDASAAKPLPPPPPPEPADRTIEKQQGSYVAKLVMRPGILKAHRQADFTIDLQKILEIPDPSTGDRTVMNSPRSYAVVQAPAPAAPEPVKGKKAPPAPSAPAPVAYQLWSNSSTGSFGFHFTPAYDGVYEIKVVGFDAPADGSTDPRSFSLSFRVGVGAASGQTEVSTGSAAARRGSRRPVGGNATADATKLQRLMADVGQRWLDLSRSIEAWPAKGGHPDAALELRIIEAVLAEAKGLVPEDRQSAAAEFDKLVAGAGTAIEEVATAWDAAEGKDRAARMSAATAAVDRLEQQSCNQCHAKFRWGLSTDVSDWPKFKLKPWKD